MSDEPYNPCDEKDEVVARTAKSWELLRRNRNFRKALEKGLESEKDCFILRSKPPDNPIANHMFDELSTDWGRAASLEEFRDDVYGKAYPELSDERRGLFEYFVNDTFLTRAELLSFDDADHRFGNRITVVGKGDPPTALDVSPDIIDHHLVRIPKRVPSKGHIKAICESIGLIIEVDGPSISPYKPSGTYLGSYDEWSAFLAYEAREHALVAIEASLPKTVPWHHPNSRELLEEAMASTDPEQKDIRNSRGTFKKRCERILELIEEAYPA